jgi:hypothetical protein
MRAYRGEYCGLAAIPPLPILYGCGARADRGISLEDKMVKLVSDLVSGIFQLECPR